MPVIFSFILLVLVSYYTIATGSTKIASLIPWSSWLHGFILINPLVVQSIAMITSLAGLIIAGVSVLYVRGKTLVVGGKKTLVLFTAFFLILTIILIFRVFHVVQPILSAMAHVEK